MCLSQNIIKLWPKEIPNHQESSEVEIQEKGDLLWIENVQEPTLEVFLPSKDRANGMAVVLCPGGGYAGLSYEHEGTDVAKLLNSEGYAAFVLKYRLPQSKSVILSHKAPVQDAQRALRMVRAYSNKWGIDKNQIGIMGFSAGGHLASTLAVHYKDKHYANIDSVDALSAKPNFIVLIYPVITMNKGYTHQGSRANLLGEKSDQKLVAYFSNELYVNKSTAPVFIIHSSDDAAVPVKNSLLFYEALQKENINSEIHIYESGGHGYGLKTEKDGTFTTWPERLFEWLERLN